MKSSIRHSMISYVFARFVNIVAISAFSIFVASCSDNEDEKMIEENATQFCNCFYNFDYSCAMAHCTQESDSWIRYSVSNLSQEDIDVINSDDEKATCMVRDIAFVNDSTAIVKMTINNFFRADSIGKAVKFVNSAETEFTSRHRNGRWKIHLTRVIG